MARPRLLATTALLTGTSGSALAFAGWSVGVPRLTASVPSFDSINRASATTAAAPTSTPPPARRAAIQSSLLSARRSSSDDAVPKSVQRRRSFLAGFAASSLLPFLPSSPATARGFGPNEKGPIVYGDDAIMSQKEHGTTASPVQENLRYGVSRKLADKICSYNRVFAEMGGYFRGETTFESDVRRVVAATGGPVTFYDSVSGLPLFRAPVGRTVDDFVAESEVHGWPSFRDDEVVWDNVRVLRSSGETVSTVGTHLGHNLPDQTGNRYCINLVSIAGNPVSS